MLHTRIAIRRSKSDAYTSPQTWCTTSRLFRTNFPNQVTTLIRYPVSKDGQEKAIKRVGKDVMSANGGRSKCAPCLTLKIVLLTKGSVKKPGPGVKTALGCYSDAAICRKQLLWLHALPYLSDLSLLYRSPMSLA